MRKETVLKQKDFSLNGNQYSVRQLDRGRFDIVIKDTGIPVNEHFGKKCMKTIAREYLALFGIEVGTQDGIKTYQRLKQLMDFLEEHETGRI